MAKPSLRNSAKPAGRALFIGLALGAAIARGASAPGDGVVPPQCGASPFRDNVCGPRCLSYVLAELGRPEDLPQLIREIQWPNIERGCSLLDLEHAANRHGLAAVAVESRDLSATLHCAKFAIAQIPAAGGTGLGHFVVLTLDRTGAVVVANIGGSVKLQDGLVGGISPDLLLLSDEKIDAARGTYPPIATAWNTFPAIWPLAVVAILAYARRTKVTKRVRSCYSYLTDRSRRTSI